jgi:hypothetical protein
MAQQSIPIAAVAAEVPPRTTKTIYPEPLAARVAGLVEMGGVRRMAHRDGKPY